MKVFNSLCATGAALGSFSRHWPSCLCRNLLVMCNRCSNGVLWHLVLAIWVRLVDLPILSRTRLQVMLGIVAILLTAVLVRNRSRFHSFSNRQLICVGSERDHHVFVHDLILSWGASALIPHWGPTLGVCPSYWAEVITSRCWVRRKTHAECIESRVPLQKVVDFRL